MMSLAKCCKLCEYYLPSGKHKNQGLCNRLDDPSYVFSVSSSQSQCLYENPGQEISEQDYKTKLAQSQERTRSFEASLRRASRIVASWSDSKRYALGRLRVISSK